MHTELYLASRSPRRLELLRQLGIEPRVVPSDIDESPHPDESAAEMVVRLATEKGRAALTPTPGLVLAADTAVVVNGEVLGKPEGPGEATAMLERLSGRTHEVCSGVYLSCRRTRKELSACVTTRVTFRPLSAQQIERYLASGEYADKAGAYAIQGLGGWFVSAIDGSWTNVVGLPLEPLADWLAELGVDGWTLVTQV